MGKNVTIGGNRLGSGKKMRAKIDNYYRSTHNLSQDWASTAACGVLYPCLCLPAMRGDSFDIDLNAALRTIPTKAPLFGSFKMQVDLFQVPMRLYQGILHNNPLAIGLKMSQVLFPVLDLQCTYNGSNGLTTGKMNTSSLLKYLGFSGMGKPLANTGIYHREINAIPALAYYDIFKNYYANKQEDKAYVISGVNEGKEIGTYGTTWKATFWNSTYETFITETKNYGSGLNRVNISNVDELPNDSEIANFTIRLEGEPNEILNKLASETPIEIELETYGEPDYQNNKGFTFEEIFNAPANNYAWYDTTTGIGVILRYSKYDHYNQGFDNYIYGSVRKTKTIVGNTDIVIGAYTANDEINYYTDLALQSFDLKNIDDMRYDILSSNELGTKVTIESDTAYLPYKCLVDVDANKDKMNGLVIKTYQNDIFNNWLNTEWIEGENGINELTKVEIVDGAFSMDALNFAQKLYNMLNRIAVAGATYEDWQDVVYETVKRRQIESPIFCGGMSKEIVFDEIIQNAPTELKGESQPLGTLGGRGRLSEGQKGGKVHIKCDEASFIIGIMSITPRIYYTQGNEFYLTDIKSMDDLHKPAMDGIGFQDLIAERMAWWDTNLTDTDNSVVRHKIGKLPAWIEYMTAVNKAYGEFAEPDEAGYMILSRRYDVSENGRIFDATTYVDPKKFNYAFANAELTAQNFWAQIGFNIKARRLMSARLIPHV